jgi:hypothetical protein
MYLFNDEAELNEFVKAAGATEVQNAYDELLEKGQFGEFMKLATKAAFYKAFQAGVAGATPEDALSQVVEVAVEAEPITEPGEQEKTITQRDAKEIAKEVVKAQKKVEQMGEGSAPVGANAGVAGAGTGAGTGEASTADIEQALQNAGVLPASA